MRDPARASISSTRFARLAETWPNAPASSTSSARISAYGRSLREGSRRRAFDADHHFLGEESATVAYCVTLDAVNFGSGYFPHLHKKPGVSGYYTIASALAKRFHREGPFRADELSDLAPIDCARLFGQEPASEPIAELMSLFSRSWNDLGRDLVERFEGRFTALIESASQSAARLIELLSAQPLFRDVASYRSMDVPLYKRAQILASDLDLALGGSGLGRFEDLERLTIFADNLVPHVLRLDGVLRYDERLLDRITAATFSRRDPRKKWRSAPAPFTPSSSWSKTFAPTGRRSLREISTSRCGHAASFRSTRPNRVTGREPHTTDPKVRRWRHPEAR